MNSAKEGTKCKVVTIKGKTLEAIFFAFDPKSNVLVLQTPSKSPVLPHQTPRYDYCVLSANAIKEFKVLSPPQPMSPNTSTTSTTNTTVGSEGSNGNTRSTSQLPHITIKPISALNMDKVQVRERNAVRALEKQLSSIGIGVTAEAQDIFNALSKTYPCHWDKKNIVVMDEVVITPPYKPVNCSGSNEGALERLKIVLNAERKKLGILQ